MCSLFHNFLQHRVSEHFFIDTQGVVIFWLLSPPPRTHRVKHLVRSVKRYKRSLTSGICFSYLDCNCNKKVKTKSNFSCVRVQTILDRLIHNYQELILVQTQDYYYLLG